jgi:hypothetical protein
MTEAEWLTATDPTPIVEFLMGKTSNRKFRLFYSSCSRRIWHLIVHEGYRKIVEVSEMLADGHGDESQLREAEYYAFAQHGPPQLNSALWAALHCGISNLMLHEPLYGDWSDPFHQAAEAVAEASNNREETLVIELLAQCDFIRDIFGNPFRPVTLNPSWLTSTVIALATGIYEERAFDRMPILADALQGAGCVNEDILNHCRQPGEHVKGCWVVDLLTGRK